MYAVELTQPRWAEAASERGPRGCGGGRRSRRGRTAGSRGCRRPTRGTGTIGSSGQIAGTPTTQSAPSTGPTSAPSPPITTMATTFTDSSGANVDRGRVAREQRHQQAPGERGHPARHREREQLHRGSSRRSCPRPTPGCRVPRSPSGRCRCGAAGRRARRTRAGTRGTGSSRSGATRSRRCRRRACQRRQQTAGVEELPLRDQPHRHEHRERQRGHREVEPGDAQRGQPDEHRDRGADEHPGGDGHAPRQVVDPERRRRHRRASPW